ncbi:MAG TPA: acetate uptake transporter [Thermoplasmata archaeon]|nr:acetate uptake transporter [Thermoplasmata archaeon]
MAAAGTDKPPSEPTKDPFWAPATVVGLCGFGTTTMIAGMAIATNGANWGVNNAAVFPMALAFGGTAQFVAGIVMLRRGEIFPGSAFMGYGAFWWAFTLFLSGLAGSAFGALAPYDIAWFMVVWALFTLTFAINSHYHGPGIAFVFWTLVLAFVLLAIDFGLLGAGHTVSNGLWEATGIDTFICGFAAWYVATGFITAQHHQGRKVLPY